MRIEHRIVGYDIETDAEIFSHVVDEEQLRQPIAARVIPDAYYSDFGSLELERQVVQVLLPASARYMTSSHKIQWFLEPSSVASVHA